MNRKCIFFLLIGIPGLLDTITVKEAILDQKRILVEGGTPLKVSTTGIKYLDNNYIIGAITQLGGSFSTSINLDQISFLVEDDSFESHSTKHKLALLKKIPIVNWRWLFECMWRGLRPELKKFQLLIFDNLLFSSTGLQIKERQQVEITLKNHGGIYQSDLGLDCEILLVNTKNPIGVKCDFALKNGILVIHFDWLKECQKKLSLVFVDDFIIDAQKNILTNRRQTETVRDKREDENKKNKQLRIGEKMEIKKKKKNRNKEAKYFYEQLQVIFVIDTKIYKQFIQITPSSCFTRMSFFQLESASFEKSETKNWKEKKSIRDHWNDAKIKLVNPWFLGKKKVYI